MEYHKTYLFGAKLRQHENGCDWNRHPAKLICRTRLELASTFHAINSLQTLNLIPRWCSPLAPFKLDRAWISTYYIFRLAATGVAFVCWCSEKWNAPARSRLQHEKLRHLWPIEHVGKSLSTPGTRTANLSSPPRTYNARMHVSFCMSVMPLTGEERNPEREGIFTPRNQRGFSFLPELIAADTRSC